MIVDYIRFDQRQVRVRYLANHFASYLGGKILDVGCDQAYLKEYLPGNEYTGVDIGGAADIKLNLEKVEELPFDEGHFDCVVCTDVLEHLDNFHKIFAELLRVSRKYAIIALPNCWSVARVPIGRGRGSFRHYGLPVERPADRHKWFFSISQAREFIRDSLGRDNWQLVQERVCDNPRNVLRRALRRLRYPVREHYLNRYAHTIFFVLQKS